MADLVGFLARRRVALGAVMAIVALVLAHPTWDSWYAGLAVAAIGEGIRVWAAGHLEKSREVTTSGPYRFVRHPLYVGSSIMGAGVAIAANSLIVAILVVAYLAITLTAAIRTEEAHLTAKFGSEYPDYRNGKVTDTRSFSFARAMRNREYRALTGFLAVLA